MLRKATSIETHFPRTAPGRNPFFAVLTLRERLNERPMVVFALIAWGACVSLALTSQPGPTDRAPGAPLTLAEIERASEKHNRLQLPSNSDEACRGQAWGSESAECLALLAREAGREYTGPVRQIASIRPANITTPNIF